MKIKADRGQISISNDVFRTIAGYAAMNCFGVREMTAVGVRDGVSELLKLESMSRGVKITPGEGIISVELHIAVRHGINIAEVSRQIIREVKYVIEQYTGVRVSRVDVCIDSIVSE